MNLQTIFLIGRSGCGKGTQAELLTKYFKENDDRNVFHLEAGQRFRNFIEEETYSSTLAKKVSEDGSLQPEFLSIWAWTGELIKNLEKHDHLIVDGTPRRRSEAHIMESALDFYGRHQVDVVYLNVSKGWSIDRLKERGRADDIEKSDVMERMNWFDGDVVPVLDYYRAHKIHRFHEIDGEQEIEKVHRDILDSLDI